MCQLLERKIYFLNCLFVLSAFLVFFFFFLLFCYPHFFSIGIFLSAFSHPHPPSAGIRSVFYRHPFYDRFQPLAGPGNNENPFLFQNKTRKPAFCPAFAPPLHEKKPFDSFDVIYDLYEMKQFHWLLCVAKNCDWSTKIAPLSNLTGASLLVE